MPDKVHLTTNKGSMSQRIADRLRPSNERTTATHSIQTGQGPTRTSHTVHHGGSQRQHGGMPGPMTGDGGE
jgi:hypothetical protein